MNKFLSVLILLFVISSFGQEKTYGNISVEEVTSIYDGDTFTATLKPKSYPAIIRERISIRIDSIDCPEMKDERDSIKALAQKAKQFTVEKLRSAKKIILKDVKRDKYFRIDATVLIDGWSLGDSLIAKGLAKPYDGGTKIPW